MDSKRKSSPFYSFTSLPLNLLRTARNLDECSPVVDLRSLRDEKTLEYVRKAHIYNRRTPSRAAQSCLTDSLSPEASCWAPYTELPSLILTPLEKQELRNTLKSVVEYTRVGGARRVELAARILIHYFCEGFAWEVKHNSDKFSNDIELDGGQFDASPHPVDLTVGHEFICSKTAREVYTLLLDMMGTGHNCVRLFCFDLLLNIAVHLNFIINSSAAAPSALILDIHYDLVRVLNSCLLYLLSNAVHTGSESAKIWNNSLTCWLAMLNEERRTILDVPLPSNYTTNTDITGVEWFPLPICEEALQSIDPRVVAAFLSLESVLLDPQLFSFLVRVQCALMFSPVRDASLSPASPISPSRFASNDPSPMTNTVTCLTLERIRQVDGIRTFSHSFIHDPHTLLSARATFAVIYVYALLFTDLAKKKVTRRTAKHLFDYIGELNFHFYFRDVFAVGGEETPALILKSLVDNALTTTDNDSKAKVVVRELLEETHGKEQITSVVVAVHTLISGHFSVNPKLLQVIETYNHPSCTDLSDVASELLCSFRPSERQEGVNLYLHLLYGLYINGSIVKGLLGEDPEVGAELRARLQASLHEKICRHDRFEVRTGFIQVVESLLTLWRSENIDMDDTEDKASFFGFVSKSIMAFCEHSDHLPHVVRASHLLLHHLSFLDEVAEQGNTSRIPGGEDTTPRTVSSLGSERIEDTGDYTIVDLILNGTVIIPVAAVACIDNEVFFLLLRRLTKLQATWHPHGLPPSNSVTQIASLNRTRHLLLILCIARIESVVHASSLKGQARTRIIPWSLLKTLISDVYSPIAVQASAFTLRQLQRAAEESTLHKCRELILQHARSSSSEVAAVELASNPYFQCVLLYDVIDSIALQNGNESP